MAQVITAASFQPRHVRSAPDPIGLYIRAGRNDHKSLLELMARDDARCFGFVIEATSLARHKELRERTLSSRLDAILDPRTLAAATPGGLSSEIAALPWGSNRPHVYDDFRGARGRQIISRIAGCVSTYGFTQVLAPTHVIQSAADEWLPIDCESTHLLRQELDRNDRRDVQILYVLATTYATFRSGFERRSLVRTLRQLPVDAVWLRIDGLGNDATANGVRNYIEASGEFASLRIPIVADGIGGLAGLSLLAFGTAGGIAHGVTFGERVNNRNWTRSRNGKKFGSRQRVYIPDLDLMLEPDTASSLLESSSRAHALFVCRDSQCCPRGRLDMLDNPARHFLIQRMHQVARLTRVHPQKRVERFLEDQVRPATDAVVQATKLKLKDKELLSRLNAQRNRLDAIRVALGSMARVSERDVALSVTPQTRAAREPGVNP